SDFPNWLSIFEDAIATNVAFYNTTWSDQHKFYALMQSLTDNAKAFAQDSKAKEPTQSYTIMSARLESNYSTHLTQTQLMTLMQKTKRWESTWTDHLTYLHHVHSMARVGNEFVLECLINNACPSKKNDLTIQLNPRARNDVAEQHRMVGILTRLTGTGIDFGRRHKTGGKETGQANQVYGGGGNKPGSKQRSGKDARLASMTQNQAAWQREMELDRAATNAKHDDRAVHADKERLIELQSLRELISQLRSSNIPSISTATKTYTTPPTVTKKLFTNLPRVDNSGDSGDDEDDNDDGLSGERNATASPTRTQAAQVATPTSQAMKAARQMTSMRIDAFIFAESLSFPEDDDFDSDIVSYLVRGSHVNDAPDAGAMVIRQASTVDDWVCDSGCTHHLTNNPSLLIDAHGSNLRIRIANDDHVMATLKGPAILDLVNGGKIRLNEVHYVPSISANLLSITSLNFNGIDVLFGRDIEFIDRSSRRVLTTGTRKGRLPILECVHSTALPTEDNEAMSFHVHLPKRSLAKWHAALGHISKAAILELANMHDDTDDMHITRATNDATISFVCADLLGPLKPSDRNHNRYVAVYVDHASKLKYAVPIKKKSDQVQMIKEFILFIELQYGKQTKVVRTDGGGEFNSTELDAFLKSKGIRKQVTEPDTSASNGLAENTIRVLANDVRTMLMSCDVPLTFWGYAVNYAVYIRNRVPCKGNDNNTPPLQAADPSRGLPKVSHIVQFGSHCTTYQAPKSKKIEKRAELGIILGVSEETKGYHVWLPQQGKVIVTRDVRNIAPPTPRRDMVEFLGAGEEALTSSTEKEDTASPRTKSAKKTAPPADLTIRTRKQRAAEVSRTKGKQFEALIAKLLAEETFPSVFLTVEEPTTVRQAMASKEAIERRKAMMRELDGIVGNGTWEVVERPKHTNIVSHKWVFKVKYDQGGNVDKFKARLVARGFSQRYGVDYSNTYAPVIKQASVRLIYVLAAIFKCEITHLDFPQAYLNAKTDFDIYIELPEGFDVDTKKYVGLLRKGLYGLKQSGMLWHEEADKALIALDFKRSQLDPCLYYHWDGGKITVCGLYVDDLLLFSKSDTTIKRMVDELTATYKVKNLGPVARCLGMNVHRIEGGFFLEQTSLVEELLAKHGLSDAKPQATPLALDHRYFDDGPDPTMTATEMREVIGSLLWLAGTTRPDIMFAVNLTARFLNKANENHVQGIKRILRYLRGTATVGLQIVPSDIGGAVNAEVFCDADWAGDKTNRRSTSGCVLVVNGCLVFWAAKQQAVVALSTMEAEYIAASAGI
ncbi:hypothetical protein AaE_013609, partial [Aphanomyces astaci]